MPESDILDIDTPYTTNSKITKIEYHSYIPYTNSFNENDEIRIAVQQTDVYPYLHESFIFMDGKFVDPEKSKICNNGMYFLFDQVRLEINGVEVDRTRNLGITSSLKGYLSSTPTNHHCYENSGWNVKYESQVVNTKGEFTRGNKLDPQNWGWKEYNGKLNPVFTKKPPAPDTLLNVISCACTKTCEQNCSCRKAGLLCSVIYKHCQGGSCLN
ncbi:uncharacterized protein LOC112681180 [Sipha flava]|uniref:Uncharacterized protein LOC112681180 n=1 Tax=Sipha flava TaxID=143950 RepID=A0A8B8FA36_9HEMI|nr:uncharacterized protein LOC112681180 [Sipha flava]